MTERPESALCGRCADCDHVWIIAHLPMVMEKVAKLARHPICPKCGGEKVYVADQSELPA